MWFKTKFENLKFKYVFEFFLISKLVTKSKIDFRIKIDYKNNFGYNMLYNQFCENKIH